MRYAGGKPTCYFGYFLVCIPSSKTLHLLPHFAFLFPSFEYKSIGEGRASLRCFILSQLALSNCVVEDFAENMLCKLSQVMESFPLQKTQGLQEKPQLHYVARCLKVEMEEG